MTDYVYWVVDCKTPGCESPILLYFLGPDSPSVTHVLQAPDTIEVKFGSVVGIPNVVLSAHLALPNNNSHSPSTGGKMVAFRAVGL
jgi:hypothetical protein